MIAARTDHQPVRAAAWADGFSVPWRLLRKGCGGRRRPGCERGGRPGAAVAERAIGAGDVREPMLALARLCPLPGSGAGESELVAVELEQVAAGCDQSPL